MMLLRKDERLELVEEAICLITSLLRQGDIKSMRRLEALSAKLAAHKDACAQVALDDDHETSI